MGSLIKHERQPAHPHFRRQRWGPWAIHVHVVAALRCIVSHAALVLLVLPQLVTFTKYHTFCLLSVQSSIYCTESYCTVSSTLVNRRVQGSLLFGCTDLRARGYGSASPASTRPLLHQMSIAHVYQTSGVIRERSIEAA